MKKLSNTEAELKGSVAYKQCMYLYLLCLLLSTFYFLFACIRPCDTNTMYICCAKTRWTPALAEVSFKIDFAQSLSICSQRKITRSDHQFFLVFFFCFVLFCFFCLNFIKKSDRSRFYIG